MALRTGVYVCEGCGIGGCVDVPALVEGSKSASEVVVTRTSKAFCLEDASLITKDIGDESLDNIVIGACSHRVNRQVFNFEPTHAQRVNLREHVAWSQEPGESETQELAADLMRMGIAAVQNRSAPTPHTTDHERHVLVVGGGPAGLSAAVSAADAGYAVTLVEQSDRLGGFAARLHKSFPTRSPFVELESASVDELVERVTSEESINVMLSSRVAEVSGQPGRFSVNITGATPDPASGGATPDPASGGATPDPASGATPTLEVGSVIEATGFVPVPEEHFADYGLGRLPNVISSITMEELSGADAGALARPSDGGEVTSVAILACDGPRDAGNLPYAGNVSSLVALKQARYVREHNPDAQVFIVYEDMQTPGRDEFFYRSVQEDHGVFFVRGEVAGVAPGSNGRLAVEVSESVLARRLALEADLVVVVVGMMPATFAENGDSTLGLNYHQGPKLPVGRGGFADSNFLCFPFETRRTGIYTAGCVHRLQGIAGSRRDGAAAALKAIQVIEKSSVGEAVHPRVGELGYPEFFMQKCTSCGRCSQECPFGALEPDAKGHPVINPNRCRRCGICMGACPVQVISFPDYSIEMLSAMSKAVPLDEDDPDKLRVLVLACENDAYPALDMVGINRLRYPVGCRVVPVRCLGSVNSIVVADAIQRGFDGVALLGCRSGEDYQCHFMEGSGLLGRRMDNVRETIDRLALEGERVQVLETSIADSRRLPGVLEEFLEEITAMGPNPMKGF
jgi:quinone-modifying oxidoreductase subunit QmoB